jgi:hypothetical protein
MTADALIGQRLQSVLQIQPCCFLGSAIVCPPLWRGRNDRPSRRGDLNQPEATDGVAIGSKLGGGMGEKPPQASHSLQPRKSGHQDA